MREGRFRSLTQSARPSEAPGRPGARRHRIHAIGAVALFALSAGFSPSAWGDDALLDTQRHEFIELFRKGDLKTAEMVCQEILKTDPTHYQDHLNLAHVYAKLGKHELALAEYQAVRDLLPVLAQNNDERAASEEANRQIQQLDPTVEKVRRDINDLDNKLQALQRTCRESQDQAGFDRVQHVRDGLISLLPGRTHSLTDVSARAEWVDTGMVVLAGMTYNVFAPGTWGYGQGRGYETDAGGSAENKNGDWPIGALIASIGGGPPFLIGKSTTFVAPATGPIRVEINDNKKDDNWGSLKVYVALAVDAAAAGK